MTRRRERANSTIKRFIADFVSRNIGAPNVLITVLRVEMNQGLTEARIFLSVWPESKEKEILKEIRNNKRDFYEYMKKKLKIKYMPEFRFEIDRGEKIRQKVEEILQKKK